MIFAANKQAKQREGNAMKPALFVREIRLVMDEAHVHLVGFATEDGEERSQLHPVAHLVMSNSAFRRLLADGRLNLAKGGH